MKKVLIVTYYWPPAGGPGVQRWLEFVKHLSDFEIEAVVYTPENPIYPLIDESLKEEVPESVTVVKHPIWEPYRWANLIAKKQSQDMTAGIIEEPEKQSWLQSLLLYIRGNFFIPDARKFWIKPSVNFLKKYMAEEGIDTLITTGPPHSLHLIGLKLKKEGVTWIADFRDPWTSIGYHKKLKLSKAAQKKHKQLEKKVLQNADQLITTSFSTKTDFQKITQTPVEVITNGFAKQTRAPVRLSKKFSLAHIGSLLSGRNPKNLWQVLAELIQENSIFRENLQLQLVGKTSPQVLNSLREYGLINYLEKIPYVSHQEALTYQQKAQILLLIEIDSPETRAIIPGKLFEYLNARRPIIAVGPKGWDVEQILNEIGGGSYFSYEAKASLKNEILSAFEKFQRQELVSRATGIEKFSRHNLAKRLAHLIKSID